MGKNGQQEVDEVEIDDQVDGDPELDEPAGDDANDDIDNGEDAEADGEEPEAEAALEDEDERFVLDSKGKPVPLNVFKKKLRKHKEKLAAKDAEWQSKLAKALEEHEGYKKSTTFTPEQVTKYKGLETVFTRFNEAVEAEPWLQPFLWALGSGDEPDYAALKKALDMKLTANAPRTDPLITRQLQQLQQQTAAMQEERLAQGVESHIVNENRQIAKILGSNREAMVLLNEMAARMTPERGTLADLPDRVALARRIAGLSKAGIQNELKKRVPKPGASRVPVKIGKSGLAGARTTRDDDDPPPLGTDEWRAWAAGR